MMVGNRGETAETFRETLAFLERAKPHQYIFACLSVYPGTRDYDEAVKAGWLDAEFYFERDFQELKTTFDASEEDTALFREWFSKNKGLKEPFRESIDEYKAIADRLSGHHAAHIDLGGAFYREGLLDEAEAHVRRAMDLGYPLPGLALNYLACVAARRGDIDGMNRRLAEADSLDPQHWVVRHNRQVVQRWLAGGMPLRDLLPRLEARHDFQLLERMAQPTLPGPLPEDFATWSPPASPAGVAVRDPRKLRVLVAPD
jgi:tetratricopeptide (TPR) repeat protein